MKGGVIRNLIDDAGYLTGAIMVQIDGFTHGRPRPEILVGKGPGDDEAVRLEECGLGIAFKEGEVEETEEIGIDEGHLLLLKLARSIPDEVITQLTQPG